MFSVLKNRDQVMSDVWANYNDYADFYNTWEEAYDKAQEIVAALADGETVTINECDEDGDFSDFRYDFVKADGAVIEYRNGDRCWL